LGHGAGQHYRPSAVVFLYNRETVLVGELLDRLEIGRVRPELLDVFVMCQVTLRLVSAGYFSDLFLKRVMLTTAENQSDFQPFRRVRLSHRPCAGQRRSLATDERISWHSSTLLG